jgi:hypothetical protein
MESIMRLLVCGGRDFANEAALRRVLDKHHSATPVSVLIQGGARGADTLAANWARTNGVECHEYPADWDQHGKRAGYLRNQQMLDEGKPDFVIAFPTQRSRGTEMMVQLAINAGIHGIRHNIASENPPYQPKGGNA